MKGGWGKPCFPQGGLGVYPQNVRKRVRGVGRSPTEGSRGACPPMSRVSAKKNTPSLQGRGRGVGGVPTAGEKNKRPHIPLWGYTMQPAPKK